MKFTAKQIAEILSGEIVGNAMVEVNSLAKIEDGKEGDLCFLANEKYTPHIYTTKASIIIINNSFKADKSISSTLIKVDDAYNSFRVHAYVTLLLLDHCQALPSFGLF